MLNVAAWNVFVDNDLVADAAKPLIEALTKSRNATLATMLHSGNRTIVQITVAIAATHLIFVRSRIRAPREMAVCHAFGQGGDARWPFARHPASEMAVCLERRVTAYG